MAWFATICLRMLKWLVRAVGHDPVLGVTRASRHRVNKNIGRSIHKAIRLPEYKAGCT